MNIKEVSEEKLQEAINNSYENTEATRSLIDTIKKKINPNQIKKKKYSTIFQSYPQFLWITH